MNGLIILLVSLLIGIAIGGLLIWILMYFKLKSSIVAKSNELLTTQQQLRGKSEALDLVEDKQRQMLSNLDDLKSRLFATEKTKAILEQKNTVIPKLEERLEFFEIKLKDSQQENANFKSDIRENRARHDEEQKSLKEKIALLQDAEKNLHTIFENTANKIFEKKQEIFKAESKESLSNSIDPLKKEFESFKNKVDMVFKSDSNDRRSISDQIKNLSDLNNKINQEAINLTKALKGDKKKQGNWGEIQLERILEDSGLEKGREYETQVSLTDEKGRRKQPDVIIRLPENKDIIIDAKVSLVDYEKYYSTEDEIEKEQALKSHIAALKKHVDGLSHKSYEDLEGIRTLDFVLIFIPIEPAFLIAFETEPSMFQKAFEKSIMVVSPTTLIPVLKIVHSIWRYERQNKNAEAIARQAGDLHDKFVLFIESMEKVGKQIASSQVAYSEAHKRLISGTGNIVGRTHKLKELGAKTKKNIPTKLLDQAEASISIALKSDPN
jgi:DNA recombination protein RmuC